MSVSFIAIIPEATVSQIEKIIAKWKNLINHRCSENDYPIFAAVGYAIGEGKDLTKIIAKADKNMYDYKEASGHQ